MELIQVHTTTEKKDDAVRIARAAVDQKLAACAQITGPIESIYRWQNQTQQAQEWLCTLKTTRGLFDRLAQVITALHPYELPQITAVPVTRASAPYARWVIESTSASI